MTQSTSRPNLVHIWSRNTLDLRGDETLELHRVESQTRDPEPQIHEAGGARAACDPPLQRRPRGQFPSPFNLKNGYTETKAMNPLRSTLHLRPKAHPQFRASGTPSGCKVSPPLLFLFSPGSRWVRRKQFSESLPESQCQNIIWS